MSRLRLALDQLRTYDVSHTIGDKDQSGSKKFLCLSSDIGNSEGNNQRDNGSEEADQGVSNDRCNSMVWPGAFPDDSTTSNHRKAACDQKNDADIWNSR